MSTRPRPSTVSSRPAPRASTTNAGGTTELAVTLAVAVGRLRSRVREEARPSRRGVPISQLTLLRRLRDDGPTTAASLAAAEHVTQQAVGQSLTMLRDAGLVSRAPDPADHRKTLNRITPKGRRLIASILASKEQWLVRAIDATLNANERRALGRAVELLERLAAADTAHGVGPELR